MNEHTFDTMTTAALRDLDPAPTTVLTDEERGRANATFARILAARYHLPLVDLAGENVSAEATMLVPLHVLERVSALPYAVVGNERRGAGNERGRGYREAAQRQVRLARPRRAADERRVAAERNGRPVNVLNCVGQPGPLRAVPRWR